MSIFEVIKKANSFIFDIRGISCEPDSVRLDREEKAWRIYYHPYALDPEAARRGDTIEGGEYILKIDDATGKVSVFFPFFYPNL